LGVAILAGSAATCLADDELKPLVTVSFSSYDKLLSDIGVIGELGGNPDLGKAAEAMLTVLTQGKGIPSLDKKRPWGAVLLTDGDQAFTGYGMLPIADLKQLVQLVKAFPQVGEIEETNGVYKVTNNDNSFYLAQKDQWVIIAKEADDLAKAPADPAKLLGDLPTKYDVAIKASIKNVPSQHREMFLAMIQAGSMAGMQQLPDEDDDQYTLRADMAKQMMEQMTSLVNELDEFLLGWSIDLTAKNSHLDVEVTAQAGTKLAEQFALITAEKSNFSGFVSPKAAICGNWVGTFSDSDVAKIKMTLGDLRKRATDELDKQDLSEEQEKLATQVLTDLIDILEKTVEAKKTDGGVAVYLTPGELTAVVGAGIVDGNKLNKLIKQLVGELKKTNPEIGEIVQLNTETVEGVHLHAAAVPSTDEELTRVFGEKLDFILGVGSNKLVGGIGQHAAETIKDVLTTSKAAGAKEVPPFYLTIAIGAIAKFAAEVAEEDEVKAKAGEIAEKLESTEGKDHITITSGAIPNGSRVRIEVEQGVLKVLGSLVSEAAGKPAP
jgi:hypothetical protein